MANNKLIFKLEEIKSCFLNEKKIINNNKNIYKSTFDSRECVENTLFFALRGEQQDGHTYIKQAVANGACFIICEKLDNELLSFLNTNKINIIIVKNSIEALQKLATFHRQKLKAQVIGITGNIGKTTTREMLNTALSPILKTFSSNKNYNNHTGLPITICNTPINTDILILEMGMNHVGEINLLTQIAKPNIAIITPISYAHIGNFKNINEVINAKAEIFNGLDKNGYVILDKDNKISFNALLKIANNKGITNILTIGKSGNFNTKNIHYDKNFKTKYKVFIQNENINICCSLNGLVAHNTHNSLFVFAVASILKLDLQQISKNLEKFNIVSGRGDIEKINFNNKNITIINDCYNSSPEALKASLNTFANIKKLHKNTRTLAIIGDMLELGKHSKNLHKSIIPHIVKSKIDNVIIVGSESKIIFDELKNTNINIIYFKSTDEVIKEIKNIILNNDIILLKASRGMQFDKIIKYLKSFNNKDTNNN